ncbi:capsular polysaccharide export protein, LipB/KpsS family [Aeromonas hydrophila]|uniref:capsular polysaccharide export protein, LipB/KpsS family n=1 Tax=Aeromonas hydrophila TaxID=644 RepID=UPI000955E769|nr:hypothetical protein [Aeromonas hydrophila]SIR06492.1 Capsule polysaccharide biosynthesis protein [Aeromonas hydrophila]SIR30232.1 Capsule polysaccharide biosynthesis protein [Aeromonas hydrophila]
MHNISFEIPDLERLDIDDWCIIGEGEAQKKICRFMNDRGVAPPSIIYKNSSEFITEVKHGLYYGPSIVVIGSSMRYEIAKAIYKECRDIDNIMDLKFFDFSPYVGIGNTEEWNAYALKKLDVIPQIVIIDSCYNEHCSYWMSNLIAEVKRQGFSVSIIHPWQKYQFFILKSAISIVMWNGSIPILFDFVKRYIHSIGKKFLYAECGFFPQKEYFYLDRMGINFNRELATDDLGWVSDSHYQRLVDLREQFFENVNPFKLEHDYVFCPLQLPDDSNIMMNSQFHHGMQDFIDYINEFYQNSHLKVVFKPHPKDFNSYSYDFGNAIVVHEDSRSLILGAERIHGINSTVIFEAALAGKDIYCEGNCLLEHPCLKNDKILAAIISSQSSIHSVDYLYFSWLTTGKY